MPNAIFLVHDFLWKEVAFLFEDGRVEHIQWVSRGKTSRVSLSPPEGWNPKFAPVGGCIFHQPGNSSVPQGFPSSITILVQDEKGHVSRVRRGIESCGALSISQTFSTEELGNGIYWRPYLDAFGRHKGFEGGFFSDEGAWTVCSPTGDFFGVEKLSEDGFFLRMYKRRPREDAARDLFSPMARRRFLFPDGLDVDPAADKIVDIHPTLGHEVVLFQGKECRWTVLKLPEGKKRILTKVASWMAPRCSPPYIWTRLGCRDSLGFRRDNQGLLRAELSFEMWDGTRVFPGEQE
jgi:hypothetical protein